MLDFISAGFFGFLLSILTFIVVIIVISLIIHVLYIYSLYKALSITARYHTLTPALAWLLLIPLFNLGWQFYVLEHITKGIKGKYDDNSRDCGDAAYSMGLAWCILKCANLVPGFNMFTMIPYLVVWIIYWVKIAGFNKDMEMMLM